MQFLKEMHGALLVFEKILATYSVVISARLCWLSIINTIKLFLFFS
jgi:hypothetical protein